ncbi:MAG: hypothetical protein AB8G22_28405 [Saprospiraceae bacterium]
MVTEAFFVKGQQRLDELHSYLDQYMPTAKCAEHPKKCAESDLIEILVRYEFTDIDKMSELQDKWRVSDCAKAKMTKKKSILQRFFSAA